MQLLLRTLRLHVRAASCGTSRRTSGGGRRSRGPGARDGHRVGEEHPFGRVPEGLLIGRELDEYLVEGERRRARERTLLPGRQRRHEAHVAAGQHVVREPTRRRDRGLMSSPTQF